MKIYDISLTLSPQSVRWVTAQPLEADRGAKRMSRGDTNNSSSIHTSVHAVSTSTRRFILCPMASPSNLYRWKLSSVRRACAP